MHKVYIGIGLLVMTLLGGGCWSSKTPSQTYGNGKPVVSPNNVSTQYQENVFLYLEDTEHWWEVWK